MKKVLRFLGILLLILLVGFLILCAVSPSEQKVERSVEINAPKAVVWEQMVKFGNWDHWSPWQEMDTAMKWDVTENDGSVGSQYHWVGSSFFTGEGKIVNTALATDEMKYEMEFLKPWIFSGKSDGFVKVVEENGKTKAIWGFHENMSFFSRGMSAMMGGKAMMEKSFDRGLELLKNYSEAHAADMPAGASAFNIEDTQFMAHTYAGVRKVIKWADMMKFYSDTYADMGKKLGQRISGPPSDIVYKWDEQNHEADMHVGFPVADKAPVDGGTIVDVPSSAAYRIVYTGGYAGSAAAHVALGEHMGKSGKKMGLVIEEYIKGPADTKDSNEYVTNIYYLYQ